MPEEIQNWQQKDFSPTKSELIVRYLQNMALSSMWPRVLNDSDYELWDSVLAGYSIAAIRFSFDNWITGGRRFPVPADITPLCISYQEQEEWAKNPKPQRGEKLERLLPREIFALWNEILIRKEASEKENTPYIPLTDKDIESIVASAKAGTYQTAPVLLSKYFPNGNARYNRELTQAKALLNLP